MVIAIEAKQSDAKHRPEQSRGIPRLTRDDPLWRIRLLRRITSRNDAGMWKIIVKYFWDTTLETQISLP